MTELSEATEALNIAQAKLQTAEAEQQLAALTQPLVEDEWSRADPVFTSRDSTPRVVNASCPTQIDDRTEGKDRPRFENEYDLNRIRAAVRVVADSSNVAIGARNSLANYIIGTGFSYEATPKEGPHESLADRVAKVVQNVLDEFDEANCFKGDLERELFDRAIVDGECATSLFAQRDGTVLARQVEPEHITEPPTKAQHELCNWLRMGLDSGVPAQKWHYGVHTRADDIQTVFGYHVLFDDNPANFEYYSANVRELTRPVLHLTKRNVVRNVSRGISDYYSVIDYISRADKLLRNMGEGAAVSAAIAFIQQWGQGVTSSTVSSVTSANKNRDYYEKTETGQQLRNVQKFNPATILNISKGQEYLNGPTADGADNFIAILQATIRMCNTRWSMPEFMLTGDASNNNLASIREAGTPFVKFAQTEQAKFMREFREIMWKAIDFARLAGRFDFVPRDISLRSLIEIAVTPPEVEQREPQAQVDIAAKKHELGFSKKTIFTELGGDYETEQAQKEQEAPDEPPPMQMVDPATGEPVPAQQPPTGQQPPQLQGAQRGALAGAVETAESVDEAIALARSMFDDARDVGSVPLCESAREYVKGLV